MSYLSLVTSATRLGPNDLDGALALVAEAASTQAAQPFELPVIERLLDLIPADGAGYHECSPGRDIYQAEIGHWGLDWSSDEVRAIIKWWPLHDRGDRPAYAVRVSDVLTGRQRRRNPFWVEMIGGSDHEHVMKLWLPAPVEGTRGVIWISRASDRQDFSERDRTVLTVLRTHLASVREHWERKRQPALLLTKRETAVLELVRDGLTNREIATRLFISSGTVRSHLEHAFGKLDVHTRTAALARAFGDTS